MPSGVVASACTSAADRAGYVAKSGKVAALDLLDAIKEGKVKLESLKTDELPKEMQKLSVAKQRAYLRGWERNANNSARKRSSWIGSGPISSTRS